ncbi:MAG: hypothetical protein GX601_09175 [Anaerolineales bacterium]|nr:hypothetical protein [Anaerolineales bacterium]
MKLHFRLVTWSGPWNSAGYDAFLPFSADAADFADALHEGIAAAWSRPAFQAQRRWHDGTLRVDRLQVIWRDCGLMTGTGELWGWPRSPQTRPDGSILTLTRFVRLPGATRYEMPDESGPFAPPLDLLRSTRRMIDSAAADWFAWSAHYLRTLTGFDQFTAGLQEMEN